MLQCNKQPTTPTLRKVDVSQLPAWAAGNPSAAGDAGGYFSFRSAARAAASSFLFSASIFG